jgi:NADPH:quinone reductase
MSVPVPPSRMITDGKLPAEHRRDHSAYSGPMRAARLHAIGGTLQLDELPDPEPGEGEQLVEIAYASVNPLDVWITQGTVGAAAAHLPWTPGSEATGHVDGKPVLVRGGGLGVVRPGLYCSSVAVPGDWLHPLSDELDLQQVAAMPVAGITAWMSLHSRAQIGPLDRVLILGASGGVGAIAIQLAKAVGATVWGQTGSHSKVGGITANGADNVIIAGADGIETAVASFEPTVVLDSLGGPFTDAAVASIANKGRLVVFGTSSDEHVSINLRRLYRKGVSLLGYAGLVDTPDEQRVAMETLLAMMAAGSLRIPVGDVLPLGDAAEAHARILERRVEGKLVLDCQA